MTSAFRLFYRLIEQIYVSFGVLDVHWTRQKVKNYLQAKFRRHISIYGCDITTSGLEKLMSVILEF